MKIHIQYFALLKDQSGTSDETLETSVDTPSTLYSELKEKYQFTLGQDSLKVAINDEFSDWTTPLTDGDSIVFIPPVAGG